MERFQFLETYGDTLNELKKADEQMAKDLAWKIIQYGLYDTDEDSGNPIIEAVFIQIKRMIDNGKDITEKRRKANSKRTNIQQNLTNDEQKGTNDEQTALKDKREKIKDKKENILSSNEDNSEAETYGNKEINNLILELKEQCNQLGVAYEKKDERNFARHILTAKDYGEFAEKIGQNRIQFAKNIIIASCQLKYKGVCAGPKSIYQHYAEIYNEFMKNKPKIRQIVLDDL